MSYPNLVHPELNANLIHKSYFTRNVRELNASEMTQEYFSQHDEFASSFSRFGSRVTVPERTVLLTLGKNVLPTTPEETGGHVQSDANLDACRCR